MSHLNASRLPAPQPRSLRHAEVTAPARRTRLNTRALRRPRLRAGLASLGLLIATATPLPGCSGDDDPADDDARDAQDDPLDVPACQHACEPGVLLDACFAGLDPGDRLMEVLELEAQNSDVIIRIARRVGERQAVGETFAFDLVRYGVVRGGALTCVRDAAALSYDFGHHNWNERAEVDTGDERHTLTLVLELDEEPVWVDRLQASDPVTGEVLWGPETLSATRCAATPAGDLNVCFQRPRDDL